MKAQSCENEFDDDIDSIILHLKMRLPRWKYKKVGD